MKIYEVLDTWRGERLSPQGPYAVGWSGQSWEWYGDEGPESERGRYKPKGDGGEIVAINVPDENTAQQIANELDRTYEARKFYDSNVYARYGEDWYTVEYGGAWIKPMNELDAFERQLATMRPFRVKDYSKSAR